MFSAISKWSLRNPKIVAQQQHFTKFSFQIYKKFREFAFLNSLGSKKMRLKNLAGFVIFSITQLSIAASPQEVEQKIISSLKCNAQSSIWLQDAQFSVEKLEITDGKILAQLSTTLPTTQKKEYAILEGTIESEKITSLKITDEIDGSRAVKDSCLK